MKIKELVLDLVKLSGKEYSEDGTVDVIKCGDADAEIKKVAVAMFATPDVIRKAAEYEANFLIVHEPMFYNHTDTQMPYEQCHAKKEMLERLGMTVFRFHDYAHSITPDLIFEGQLYYSGLNGHFEKGKYWAVNRFILDTPMTTLELAEQLEKKLGIKHLRIAGARHNTVKTISCCFGTPGHLIKEFAECDTVLTGEICEWIEGEYVRDHHQMGGDKSMIVMGHINSEKFGMKLLEKYLTEQYPHISTRYFDCGDVYSYTDDND